MEVERRRKVSLNPFSPWRSSAESLNRTIVGRDHIIKDILDKTQRFCQGAPPKHCLLIGRRGLGKTHILALLYHYYENNCSITDFETISSDVLPVILLEEERYSLNSLAIFLIKIFIKFCEKVPGEARWIIPEHLESDEDVIEYCFGNLKEISQSEKKKIIILCDNLEEVFKQWQEKEYKILRAFLSDQQAVMLIGTSVKIFKEIISPELPFYEFFETVPLPDLSDSQMLELLKKRFIEDHMEEEFNRKEKHLKEKIAATAKLTGGNPRLVVFLYDIVTKKNVFEIENATEELMESLSEYFRNRFSALAPQEKTILDAFADMEGPATPKEISKKTRIKENSTYAHIKNLKHAGFIDTVEYGKHKISKYDVTERLFRLWRQTATISGKRKFQILIRFLKLYFTPEEIKEDFQRSLKQLDSAFLKNKSEGVEKYIHYLSYLQYAAEGSLKYEIFDKRTDFLFKIGDYDKVEEEIQAFKSEMGVEKADYDLKPVYKKLVKSHLQQEKYAEVSKDFVQLLEYPISEEKEEYIEILDKIIDECPDDDQAWYSKGRILARAEEYEDALKYFEKASELKPKEPKYFYVKALALRKLNRLEEALTFIEKAIELDGNNARYWVEKGIISTFFGKGKQALQYFQKASELAPMESSYYAAQSIHLRNLNRLEDALPLIEKAIELDANISNYWGEKGIILGNSGKLEESLECFAKASDLEPENPEYHYRKAIALRNLNRLNEALSLVDKAIELNGNNSMYWGEKGIIVGNSGKHEEALECFGKASDLEPEEPEYHYNQAVALRNLNRLAEALPMIEKAIELNRNNPSFWGEKGTIVGTLEKNEDALECFRKASDLEPDESEYHYQQAVALRNLNRLEEALKSIEKANQLAKDQPEYLYSHAYLLRNLNRSEEALPLIEKAISFDKNDIRYWYEKGRILYDLERYEESLQFSQKASDLKPEEPEYYRFLSTALGNLNRIDEALVMIEKAIELCSRCGKCWEVKGKILSYTGKHEEALKAFQKATELEPEQSKYYNSQAIALRNLNHLEEALPMIDKAIELDGNNAKYWGEKGIIVGSLRKHEEALKCFGKASDLEPEEPMYHYIQAIVLRNLDRLEEAFSLIERAIELDGNNASYWEERGIIVGNMGKLEKALQALKKASKLQPERAEYYSLQAIYLHRLNRLEEALILIEKAIELDGNNASFWGEKGIIFDKMESYDKALKAINKASEIKPKERKYYLLKTYLLKKMSRFKEAKMIIEEALELDEKNLSLWEEKSRILAETGKYEEARQCYRDSIELNPEDINHKLRFLGFLVFDIKDLEEAGNYLKEIEKTSYDKIKDNLIYIHYKSEYLILICQFEEAIPLSEKRLKEEPDDWDAKISHSINRACLGEFGEHMEGLSGKIANEKLVEYQIKEVTQFMFRIMERCLSKGDTQRSNGLYLTLLKLKEWHHIDEVQNSIALYIRQLVDLKNRDLFVQAVNLAREHITDKNLLELLKAFIYAARYLQEGNKVILEEVFPEIREIIFDIIEKFEVSHKDTRKDTK
ncbi:MAG: tetratricopeptide repeat protein [Candidatus Aminicenantes bacterium]|nr:tetratricopeptide repeat protein [Candidatus Aminicenantes bacterium]NIM85086.1 tetratricopeptide repeat protein [Candidatus Aminicenantes bacterium]NIN24593.1 tetratricopeptide repeat protein [Candidatus Aminicenantes bacterium]NIN48357.1 tetratricopeptide repeat protein [Candidatus Aminicenantes bacterium]NIN91260.1 tetratricopeptide repeat protein [Candidatus Aminicenantes bacterium]